MDDSAAVRQFAVIPQEFFLGDELDCRVIRFKIVRHGLDAFGDLGLVSAFFGAYETLA